MTDAKLDKIDVDFARQLSRVRIHVERVVSRLAVEIRVRSRCLAVSRVSASHQKSLRAGSVLSS